MGDHIARQRNSILKNLLLELRSVLSRRWQDCELVLAGAGSFRKGEFHYKVDRVMGSRVPFESKQVRTVLPMEERTLHLIAPGEKKALELLPFVKVMASPTHMQTGCYFYNRQDEGGFRFVSYHLESEPDLIEMFSEVGEALDSVGLGNY